MVTPTDSVHGLCGLCVFATSRHSGRWEDGFKLNLATVRRSTPVVNARFYSWGFFETPPLVHAYRIPQPHPTISRRNWLCLSPWPGTLGSWKQNLRLLTTKTKALIGNSNTHLAASLVGTAIPRFISRRMRQGITPLLIFTSLVRGMRGSIKTLNGALRHQTLFVASSISPSFYGVRLNSKCRISFSVQLESRQHYICWDNCYSDQSSTECLATWCATGCATRSEVLRKRSTKRAVYIYG